MGKKHKVLAKECLNLIAWREGWAMQDLWAHDGNETLRTKRVNPHVLFPNDEIDIPDPRPGEEEAPTGRRHTFVRKGAYAPLLLRLLDGGEPRSRQRYRLKVDGDVYVGRTDRQGWLREEIRVTAKQASLLIGPAGEVFLVSLRDMDPASEILGVQKRLANLGRWDGPLDGEASPEFESALMGFQAEHGLEPDGQLTKALAVRLEQNHDGAAAGEGS